MKYVIDEVNTVSPYGIFPKERNLEDLIPRSLVILDKPSGPTSHQVSSWVQDICGMKAGHSGTLDPNVTGVLPMGLGSSVRVIDLLHAASKEYIAAVRFHSSISNDEVSSIVEDFTGEIYQMPPVRSGVKRRMRSRVIHGLEILDHHGQEYLLRVRCQSGTYVRTLCKDMGKVAGTGAHMMELRRTEAGGFTEEQSCSLHDLRDAFEFYKEDDGSWLSDLLLPYESALEIYPKMIIKDTAAGSVLNGADLAVPGILKMDGFYRDDKVVIFSAKGEGLAFGQALFDAQDIVDKQEGLVVRTERVFNPVGEYPRRWKEHKY